MDFSSSAIDWSLSADRANKMRVACSLANRRAMAAPIPMDAPVIRMFCPLRAILSIDISAGFP